MHTTKDHFNTLISAAISELAPDRNDGFHIVYLLSIFNGNNLYYELCQIMITCDHAAMNINRTMQWVWVRKYITPSIKAKPLSDDLVSTNYILHWKYSRYLYWFKSTIKQAVCYLSRAPLLRNTCQGKQTFGPVSTYMPLQLQSTTLEISHWVTTPLYLPFSLPPREPNSISL